MSDKSFLERYVHRGSGPVAKEEDAQPSADLSTFGWLRGQRDRAPMLELRRANGNILAVGYGFLDQALFDPSDGIMLHVGGRKIQLKGRNLNAEVRPGVRLFEGICRHRIAWVRETGTSDRLESGDDATIVERIEW